MSIRARVSWYFLASAVAAAISFVTLPLTTLRLGPAEYGIFALGATIAGVGASIASVGATYLVSSRWTVADEAERAAVAWRLVSVAAAISVAWATGAAVVVFGLSDRLVLLDSLPDGFAFALAATVLAPYWAVAADVLVVEGRAAAYAFAAIAQSVATAAATLIALFAFDLGVTSLFVGFAAAGCVAFVSAALVLGPALRARARRSAPPRDVGQATFALSHLSEEGHAVLERILLARFAGFADLGLYTHSQRYRALVFQAAKAIGRGVWPETLAEARDLSSRFPITRRTWSPLYVAVTAAGLALTAVGDKVIAVLTNDRFTDAWVYLGPWFALTLVQLSANPELATLNALGRGRTLARLVFGSNLAAIVAAAALIPPLGAPGAVVALAVRAVASRTVIRVLARRQRQIPFTDGWAAFGVALVLAAWLVKLAIGEDVLASVVLLIVAEALCLAAGARVLGESWQRVVASSPRPSAS